MKASKSNNQFISSLAIWAWLLRSEEAETVSLQPSLPSGATLERLKLEEQLSEVQRDARCVRRAVQLMVFLTGLALVGLGHSTILMPDWPQTMSQFLMQWT